MDMVRTTIDHLVLGVPSLDEAIDWFEQQSGVRPIVGGAHDGLGTHNALVSLGSSYLELLAPDPDQPEPTQPRPFGIDHVREPTMLTFAVRPVEGSIDDVVAAAEGSGWDPGPILDTSRLQPSGDRLMWRLTPPPNQSSPHQGAVPFIIDWSDTPNPATTTPIGCTLDDLIVAHPAADDVAAIYRAIGLDVPVVERPTTRVSAAITTPKGNTLLR